MSPMGSKTGQRNSELNCQLAAWAKADGKGVTFDSSAVFSPKMEPSVLRTRPGY